MSSLMIRYPPWSLASSLESPVLGMTFPVVVVIMTWLLEHRRAIGLGDDCRTTCEVLGFVGKETGNLVILCDALANGCNTLLLKSVRWYILSTYLKVFATDGKHSVRLQRKWQSGLSRHCSNIRLETLSAWQYSPSIVHRMALLSLSNGPNDIFKVYRERLTKV